jgi:rhodanese-related sulfurtransferase
LLKNELICIKIKVMGLFNFLSGGKNDKIKEFQSRDAVIIDVRTTAEYKQGAIPGSKNIPLQTINGKIDYLRNLNKPIITCCASGMRSGSAASTLNTHGLEAINGGGWQSLFAKIKS